MITIAWDVDDILNNLMYHWLTEKWLPEHPKCKVSFEQIIQNTPEQIIKSTLEEYKASLDSFRLSKAYFQMQPEPQILIWFKEHGDKARHIALTAVPVRAAHVSADWVIRNFGKWIRSFNFVPSPRVNEQVPDYGHTKTDYLKWLNKIDVLIEDNEKNIREAEELGIKGILVKKPWNKGRLLLKDALAEINQLL